MDARDFQRNLNSSWAGMSLGHVLPYLNNESWHADIDIKAFNTALWIPFNRPSFGTSTSYTCSVLLPTLKDGLQKFTVRSLPWRDDDDLSMDKYLIKTPKGGMKRHFSSLAYISLAPVQATPRGFCPGHASIQHFMCRELESDLRTQGRYANEFSYEVIWDMFNPYNLGDLNQAAQLINNGERLGVPISRFLGMYAESTSTLPVLAYKENSVGTYDQSTRTIKLYRKVSSACDRYLSKLFPYTRIVVEGA